MSAIEKTIEYFAPRSALKRKAAKLRLRSIEAASRKPRIAHWGAHEKTKIDSKDITTLRERSRHLTTNNPLGSRALGLSPRPPPLAPAKTKEMFSFIS